MRLIISRAKAIISLFNSGILLSGLAINVGGAGNLQLVASSAPAASVAPSAPQSANLVLDEFNNILSQACQTAYAQGFKLNDGWQNQLRARGLANYARDLVAFRDAAAECLEKIGDLINQNQLYPNITSTVTGTWTFAPNLWIATNSFAETVADDPSLQLEERIAKASPQSKNFSIALDQFAHWISETENHLTELRSHLNEAAPQ